ncbi:glycerol-3-phosphate acyltransferase [Candidatus Poriferisocius sp.]|uniref:glycerol-3-phosphate acyltransferase n=1 Tax=Candidatus Poriferisocius sp. TaxID=3101276 RepID=UPI003B02B314
MVAFAAGAVPFSYLMAQSLAGTDLRQVGTGTVSGTGLYRVAGFVPLVAGGLLDVGKGALGPLLAGDRWLLMAFAGAVSVIGHNWSLFINGAGGRGLSPALGAFAVIAWPAALFLLGGLAAGRILRQTGLVVFLTMPALPGFLLLVGDGRAAVAGTLIILPILIKRVLGNEPLPTPNRWRAAAHRLVFDNDSWVSTSRAGH